MKSLSILMAIVFLLAGFAVCRAGNTATIDVSANVPTSLELSWGMAKVDSKLNSDPGDDVWTPNQTAMAFGDLRYILGDGSNAGLWFSQYYFPIFMSAITGGLKYKITQTSVGLSNAATKLPKAWGIASVRCWNTTTNAEVGCPAGATKLTSGGPAEATQVLYDSGTGAAIATVRADYGIPPFATGGANPFAGYVKVPLDQKAGTYSGSVTITLTTY